MLKASATSGAETSAAGGTPANPIPRVLTWRQLVAYALPSLVASMMIVPLTAVIPTIYEKCYSISFAAIGLALTLSRLFDAFIDPVTAYLSDKTKTRLGARKPWIIAGAIIAAPGVFFLFSPPVQPDAMYFLIWSSVVYLGWTLITIPYNAWGAEISGNYNERSTIVTVAGMVGAIGTVLFFAAPIVLPFTTEDITPEVMRAVGWITILCLPLCIAAVFFVPNGVSVATFEGNLWRTTKGLFTNKPFQRFLIIFTLQGFALGIYATLLFAFVDGYLHIGEQFARVFVVTTIGSFVSIPAWLWASNKFGKHMAWAVGSLTTNLTLVGYIFLTPGESAVMPALVIGFIYGALSSCATIAYPAILADIIDYGTLRTGMTRAGSYFAVTTLLVKSTAAIGGGLAIVLIGLFSFSTQPDAVNTPLANAGMLFTFVGIHTVLQMIAIPLIWTFPLDRRRQQIVRLRIERRAARQAIEQSAS